jgi:hypothetical protein
MMKKTIPIAIIFLLPTLAFGNVVWPALYTETKASSLPIIGLSLALEYLVIRRLFGQSLTKSVFYTVAANLVSGILGLVLRPLSGLAWELSLGMLIMWLFNWGTFNPVTWFFVPVVGGAINALLELLTIKLIWKEKFSRKAFLYLWMITNLVNK